MHKPWQCDKCHKRYHRVNKMRVWPTRNPGRRHGWDVEEIYLCTECMDTRQAQHVIRVAQVKLIHSKSA